MQQICLCLNETRKFANRLLQLYIDFHLSFCNELPIINLKIYY